MHALIVDDSKTARYALRQLLDKQKVSVDMVESAEDALDYLEQQGRSGDAAPDLIFMDHMMPGMDGFEAVKELKANPSTADIPIVMYTSTQGGMYFGQARALGAADVINKPATAEDLREVLRRLREQQLVEMAGAIPVAAAASSGSGDTVAMPAVESANDETSLFVEAENPARVSQAGYWLAAVLLLPLLYFGWRYAELSQQVHRQQDAVVRALGWAINQPAEFAFGDIPFSDARARELRELVTHLNALGYRGRVVLEGHVGVFCLQRDAGGGRAPVTGDIPLTECAELGQVGDPQQISGAQSTEFRRVMQELSLQDGGIQVEVRPRGTEVPLIGYAPDLTGAQWNRIAQHNQRVNIMLEPAAR
jgi:CheY-like chemotaxis protein